MMPNFFPCCNRSQPDDRLESSDTLLPRKIISKNRTCDSLRSPKSSLKTLASLRSQKNQKDLSSSADIHLVSTVDLANFESERNVYLPNCSPIQQKQKGIQVSNKHSIKKIPPPILFTATTPKIRKQIINFTYKNPNNPELLIEKIQPPLTQSNAKVPKIQVKFDKSSIRQTPKETGRSNNIINNQKGQLTPAHSSIKNQTAVRTTPKFKLGGSKFTVLSEETPESQGEPNMEESTILVNIFHPSISQVGNWQIPQRKVSFQEAIDWDQ